MQYICSSTSIFCIVLYICGTFLNKIHIKNVAIFCSQKYTCSQQLYYIASAKNTPCYVLELVDRITYNYCITLRLYFDIFIYTLNFHYTMFYFYSINYIYFKVNNFLPQQMVGITAGINIFHISLINFTCMLDAASHEKLGILELSLAVVSCLCRQSTYMLVKTDTQVVASFHFY